MKNIKSDIIGQKFNMLTVIGIDKNNTKKGLYVIC